MAFNLTTLTKPTVLACEERGGGTALVLLHGFPFDRTIWYPQASVLSKHYRVIMPDLRGHGQSPAPSGAYTMDLMAQDVLVTLDRLGVGLAVWAGHSMGGYVTMAAWRLAPERFAGLALVASNHLADSPEARTRRYETAKQVAERGPEAAINPKLFAEGTPPTTPYVEMARQITLRTPRAGLIGTLLAMAERPDSTETLKTINVPALVIGAEGDQLFKPEIPRQMAALIPNAELVMIAGSGHMPMLEQPDVTTQALASLLEHVGAKIG